MTISIQISPKHLVVFMALLLSFASVLQLSRTVPSLRSLTNLSTITKGSTIPATTVSPTTSQNFSKLKTLGEIKRSMTLPCNYVHDGFFVPHSNEITNQVYQTLMELKDDDIVPVFIEVGGHDGITKSMSLKVSRCLNVNTMLIEASPSNYKVLKKARSYDLTVNAALCEGDYAEMEESDKNSGQSKLHRSGSSTRVQTVKVPCTTIDQEMDKLKAMLPPHLQPKLELVFLVLDVEGFEPIAIKGLNEYSPMKAYIEWTRVSKEDNERMLKWATWHNLQGDFCGPLERDMCFNFHPTLFFTQVGVEDEEEAKPLVQRWSKDVFYGARFEVPKDTHVTSRASESYMFYGE